jgi:hypothetical protein
MESKNLMKDPYTEEGSQSFFSLKVSDFNSNYIPGKPIRIVLNQPCNTWKKFEIRNVQCFGKKQARTITAAPALFKSHSLEGEEQKIISELIASDYRAIVKASSAFPASFPIDKPKSVDTNNTPPSIVVGVEKEKNSFSNKKK